MKMRKMLVAVTAIGVLTVSGPQAGVTERVLALVAKTTPVRSICACSKVGFLFRKGPIQRSLLWVNGSSIPRDENGKHV